MWGSRMRVSYGEWGFNPSWPRPNPQRRRIIKIFLVLEFKNREATASTTKERQVKFFISCDDFPFACLLLTKVHPFKNGMVAEEGNLFCVLNHVFTSNQQVLANCYCGSYSPFFITSSNGKDRFCWIGHWSNSHFSQPPVR